VSANPHLVPVAIALVLFVPLPSVAHEVEPTRGTAWITEMAAAASAWLRTVGTRDGAQLPFADGERRNWHYIPRSRRGVALRDMTSVQRGAAASILRAGLSSRGVERAEAIMALESVLAEVEGSSRSFRDPLNYVFTVFGTPGTPPWGWRVEGHHLSVNVTVAAPGHAAVTPLFSGTHPARIPFGPRRGERIQRMEYVLGLELAQSLDDRQLAGALLQERSLGNIVSGPGRASALARPMGLPFDQLRPPQQAKVLQLIELYVGLARDEVSRPYMALVREGLQGTRFAWAGGRREGTAFYYRIHGPRVLIEFDNTQNDANHIHSVWRDPVNDFGRDDLREHYGDGAHRLPPPRDGRQR
jgi:hypothetical protein